MNESSGGGLRLAVRDVVDLYSFHKTHGSCFAFSPDGTRLAFCVQRPLAAASHYADMFLAGIARSTLFTAKVVSFYLLEKSRPGVIPFQHFEDQNDPSITALCVNMHCRWTGPSNQAKHLANDPVCPACKDSSLQLVEEDDDISGI